MFSNCGEFYFLRLAIISLINPSTLVGPKLASDLYVNSTGGKLLSNDSQVGVTGSMDIEKMYEITEEFEWRTRRKFPASTLCYSKGLRNYLSRWCLAFSEIFELEARSVEGQSGQQKDTKRRKNKDREKKINKNSETAKDVGHFLVSRNLNFCVCSTKCPKMRCLWEERHAVML